MNTRPYYVLDYLSVIFISFIFSLVTQHLIKELLPDCTWHCLQAEVHCKPYVLQVRR